MDLKITIFLTLNFFSTTIFSYSIPPNCGNSLDDLEISIITKPEGKIRSPGYNKSGSYPEQITCVWTFDSEPQYYSLKFNDFDLDETGLCSGDRLSIVNSEAEDDEEELYIFCGRNKPRDLDLGLHSFMIIFTSDLIYSGRGFEIEYKLRDAKVANQGFFECKNREWISDEKVCDGVIDCNDGWDESDCKKSTSLSEFNCGQSKLNNVSTDLFVSRIIGGQASSEGVWPWQVSLQFNRWEPSGHFCGGSLIHPQFVITAAHCVNEVAPEDIRIAFGFNDAFKTSENQQIRYIKRGLIYPQISLKKARDAQLDMLNDIALIKLNAPVILSDYVSPICFDYDQDISDVNLPCFVTGWGMTKGTGNSGLLKQLPVVRAPLQNCAEEDSEEYGKDIKSQICIKSRFNNKGVGVCSGDSGGPLVCKVDSKWQLIGVASRVLDGTIAEPVCGIRDGGAIYSSVQTKRKWILKWIKKLSNHK